MNTCQTCSFWSQDVDSPETCDPVAHVITNPAQVGLCDKIHFVALSEPAALDRISCWAPNMEHVSAVTGPNFGCIHRSPK